MTSARLALILAFAVTLGAAAPAGAATSCSTRAHAHFVGLGGGDSLNSPFGADCVMAAQAKAGAGVLRQGFDWSRIERSPGHYDFSAYDGWVAAAARRGMRILPILSNPPSFRARAVPSGIAPPTSNAAFAHFAAAAVRHYGPRGDFWRTHPTVPKRPIRSWQVWNEPNLPQYWGGQPSAKRYTKLLKATYVAIRKVDRHADVVTAGLPDSLIKHAIQARRYIPQLYRAHAQRWFTTLAVNPYSHTARGVVSLVERFRRTMLAHHDRADHLWVTEVGWGTSGPKSRFNLGRRGQARQLKLLLPHLYKLRHRLKLRGVIWYGWQDRPAYSHKAMWGLYTGLRTLSGTPKPSYTAFARIAPKLK